MQAMQGPTNTTHRSTTDGECRLYRKDRGKEAKLSDMGHAAMEKRNRLMIDDLRARKRGSSHQHAGHCGSNKSGQDGHRALDQKPSFLLPITSDAFNDLVSVILKHAIFLSELSEFIHITRRIGKLAVTIGAIVQPFLWQHILRCSYKPQYIVVVGYDLPERHKIIVSSELRYSFDRGRDPCLGRFVLRPVTMRYCLADVFGLHNPAVVPKRAQQVMPRIPQLVGCGDSDVVAELENLASEFTSRAVGSP